MRPYDFMQHLALDVFHRNKNLSIRFIDFVNGGDVGIIQRRGGFGFVDEALLVFFSLAEMWRQKLQGDEAVEFDVLRFVDYPHSAGA